MRVAGITIPDGKRLEIGLTSIFGIGRSLAHVLLSKAGIDYGTKPTDLTSAKEAELRKAIEDLRIEGDLKREISGNIKRLKDVKAYRGVRHMRGLPTKGQRTKVNSRTVRGNVRKTMGSGKTKTDKK